MGLTMNKELAYKRHNRYKSQPNRQYAYLKGKCRRNGVELSLTLEQYIELRKMPCHYCGHKLPLTGYCLDRKDGTIGYSVDNTVPCCTICNFTKHSIWSYEEYIEIAKVVSIVLDRRILSGNKSLLPHDRIKHKE